MITDQGRSGMPSKGLVDLPSEILSLMASLCNKQELLQLRLTSRRMNAICLQTLYRILVQEIIIENRPYLHQAAAHCSEKAIQFLLEAGAPVMYRNALGETALHIAVRENCIAGVVALLQAQADMNAETIHAWTPLQLAARHGHDYVLSILLKYGADPDIRGFHGWTALHYAARSGHLSTVEALMAAGSDIEIFDNDKRTPVDEASRFEHREIVRFLTSDLNLLISKKA